MADSTPTQTPEPAPDPAQNESGGGALGWFWFFTKVGMIVLVILCAGGGYSFWNWWHKPTTTDTAIAAGTKALETPEPAVDNNIWLTTNTPTWPPGSTPSTIEFVQVEIPGAKNPIGNTIWVYGLVAGQLECWTGSDGDKTILTDATVTDDGKCNYSDGTPIPGAYAVQRWLDDKGMPVDLIAVRAALAKAGMSTVPVPVPGYNNVTVACVATETNPCELASQ